MIRAAIIDGNKPEADLAEESLRLLTARRTNEPIQIERYASPQLFMTSAAGKVFFQMAVIDISGPGGIEAARRIRGACRTVQILLMADRCVSPDLYVHPSVGACYLILRPGNRSMIRERMKEMFDGYIRALPDREIWVRGDHGQIRLPLEDVIFFESRDGVICARTRNGDYCFRDTLAGLEKRLDSSFFRCHRCYLVNRHYVREVRLRRGDIQLFGGLIIPLGRTYHEKMKSQMGRENEPHIQEVLAAG